MAKSSAQAKGRASRKGEPGPDRLDRLLSTPRPTVFFCVLALLMAGLAVRAVALSTITGPADAGYAIFGAFPTAIAFLLPAALWLRHPRIWTTDRVLAVGAVLFGVVEVLQYISPGLSGWFVSLIPPPDGMPFLSPLDVGFSVVVGLLGAMAPFAAGRGLSTARAYEDAPRVRRWWLIVVALTLVAGVTNVLLLVNLSLDIPPDAVVAYFWLTVLSVVLSLLSVFGWAYLAGVALVGWRSGEAPGRGWLLASLAACLILLGLAVSGVFAAIGVFTTPLPPELSIGILAAFALAYVLLGLAFLVGLPGDLDD